MSVILILILVSIVVAIIFLTAFFWAVRSGQFDDTHSPAVRILFESSLKGKVQSTKYSVRSKERSDEGVVTNHKS